MCLAGIYMCIESWLNDKASNETRGTIVSSYMVTLYAAMAVGQQLLNLNAAGSPLLFMIVSILLSLSLVPVCLTRAAPPSLPDVTSFSLRALYKAPPLGLVGVFLSGGFIGAIYGLAPVYAAASGYGMAGTATFMTVLITGGVLLQFPLGRLSDIFDRRTIIIAACSSLMLLSIACSWSAMAPGCSWSQPCCLGGYAARQKWCSTYWRTPTSGRSRKRTARS